MACLYVGDKRINQLEEAGKCDWTTGSDTTSLKVINRKWHHYAPFGDTNSAEMAYDKGFQRSYHIYAGASLLKCAALSLMALPALIVRVICVALYALTQICRQGVKAFDPLVDQSREASKAFFMLLSGVILGTFQVACSILRDPLLWMAHQIQKNNSLKNSNAALIIIDAQKDFNKDTKGRLGVQDGNLIVPVIKNLRDHFVNNGRNIVGLSLDWHPYDHCSFAANAGTKADSNEKFKALEHITVDGLDQILWPVHCVQNSPGAQLIDGIDPKVDVVIRKGLDRYTDSYSAVADNGGRNETILVERLQYANIKRVYLAGIASNVCVLATAVGLAARGFDVTIVDDACKGVDLVDGHQKTINDLQALNTSEFLKQHLKIQVKTAHQLITDGDNPDFELSTTTS